MEDRHIPFAGLALALLFLMMAFMGCADIPAMPQAGDPYYWQKLAARKQAIEEHEQFQQNLRGLDDDLKRLEADRLASKLHMAHGECKQVYYSSTKTVETFCY